MRILRMVAVALFGLGGDWLYSGLVGGVLGLRA